MYAVPVAAHLRFPGRARTRRSADDVDAASAAPGRGWGRAPGARSRRQSGCRQLRTWMHGTRDGIVSASVPCGHVRRVSALRASRHWPLGRRGRRAGFATEAAVPPSPSLACHPRLFGLAGSLAPCWLALSWLALSWLAVHLDRASRASQAVAGGAEDIARRRQVMRASPRTVPSLEPTAPVAAGSSTARAIRHAPCCTVHRRCIADDGHFGLGGDM